MCAQNEGQQYLKACAKFIIGELRLALLVLLLRFRRLEFFRKAVVAIVTDGVAKVGEGRHTFAALRAGSERREGSLAAFVQPPCLMWPGGLRGNQQLPFYCHM